MGASDAMDTTATSSLGNHNLRDVGTNTVSGMVYMLQTCWLQARINNFTDIMVLTNQDKHVAHTVNTAIDMLVHQSQCMETPPCSKATSLHGGGH